MSFTDPVLGQKGYILHDILYKDENKILVNYFTVIVFGGEHSDERVIRCFLWQCYVSQGQSDELVPLENTNSSAFMTYIYLHFCT